MSIQKSEKLRSIRYDIRGPISEEAERMEERGIKIIKLNTGNPAAFGFETPDYILHSLQAAAARSAPYSTSKGIREAREAVARYCADEGILGVEPEDIYTGNGVSELITLSLQALINTGDEILIPTPDYPLWTAAAILAGGTPVHYLCDEQSDWYPDIEDMRRKITGRTKAVVIINPNNPTGAVYPKELLEKIVELARQNGLVLFSDEIYNRLVMDGVEYVSTASLAPDLPAVTFNGLSKSHHICGFRCGWMVVSGRQTDSYKEGLTMLASLRLCSNVLAQSVIKSALEDRHYTDKHILPGGRLYEQRECAYKALSAIPGITAVKPQAGLYIFPKINGKKLRIEDDARFVLDFLREKQVLLTHGGSYNWKSPDHFRLLYLPRVEELTDVLGRLRDFLSGYRQY